MTDLVDLLALKQQVLNLNGRIQSVQAQNEVPAILHQIVDTLEEFEVRLRDLEPEEDNDRD